MEFSEKQKFNGFNGFINGQLFKDNNAFMIEDRAKLAKRSEKELNRRRNNEN